ncbi:nickel-dependent lactate racemase [candidate division KSB1 bacterium]|nr:nickel-dependent lactate racemase [candidate division KSB1 bacterium]
MKIKLEFGTSGLDINVPDQNLAKVLKMRASVPVPDPVSKLEQSLKNPIGTAALSKLADGKKTACVVICDITRPVPNKIILPPILSTLENSGIKRENITILIATGIHRPNEGEELVYLVGEDIIKNYRIVNHFAKDDNSHKYLGKTSRGTDIFIDSTYVNADLKITTGFIEPHLMAGFSGGRKLICPGIASIKTVKVMHGPDILEHPNAREGIIEGNPFHEEVLEIAHIAGVDFILNVALNETRQITGIFAGDLEKAHAVGINFVRDQIQDFVDNPVDIVITTSAGYPLDATFYQAVKGLTAALPIVKQEGTIILAAECRESLGGPEFSQLVYEVKDLDQFMTDIYRDDYFVIDQWQFEKLVNVLKKVDVLMYTECISDIDKEHLPVKNIASVEAGIKMALQKHGKNAKIAVIPKGPYILANLKETE